MLAIRAIVTAMNRRDFGRIGVMGLTGMALPRATALAQGGAYRYVHVDVFTDRRLQGNQLLVFVQPAGLDVDRMQALTRDQTTRNARLCSRQKPPAPITVSASLRRPQRRRSPGIRRLAPRTPLPTLACSSQEPREPSSGWAWGRPTSIWTGRTVGSPSRG